MVPKWTLARVLCDRGVCVSFAEAKRLAMKGMVKINHNPVNNAMVEVKTGDYIEVHNKWSKVIELIDPKGSHLWTGNTKEGTP